MSTLTVAVTLLVLSQPARNVVIVVTDGLRPTEVFDGPQRALMGRAGGVEEEAGLVDKYWRPQPEDARATLLPFLWGTVVRHGQIFGNTSLQAGVKVTNTRRLSYPGYNELFTGVADPRITSNEYQPNPNVTVLEWLNHQPGFEGRVQAFATWGTFTRIFNVDHSHLDVRAGLEPPFGNDPVRTPGKDAVDAFHRAATPVFGGNALDAFTFLALKESLKTNHPKVLFVGFGETDEWMHAGRYDLTLEAAHRADQFIAELWSTLQSLPQYRDQTTLIVTTDHGRGRGADNWRDHGAEVEGSDDIWVAVMGPEIPPLGERSQLSALTQGQVAATIARAAGYDWQSVRADAAPALPLRGAQEQSRN